MSSCSLAYHFGKIGNFLGKYVLPFKKNTRIQLTSYEHFEDNPFIAV